MPDTLNLPELLAKAEAEIRSLEGENARLRQALFGGPAMERVAEGKTKFSASIRQEPKG